MTTPITNRLSFDYYTLGTTQSSSKSNLSVVADRISQFEKGYTWESNGWFLNAIYTAGRAFISLGGAVKSIALKVWNVVKSVLCLDNPLRSLESFLRQDSDRSAERFFKDPVGTIEMIVDAYIQDYELADKIVEKNKNEYRLILAKFTEKKKEEFIANKLQNKTFSDRVPAEKKFNEISQDLLSEDLAARFSAWVEIINKRTEMADMLSRKTLGAGVSGSAALINVFLNAVSYGK